MRNAMEKHYYEKANAEREAKRTRSRVVRAAHYGKELPETGASALCIENFIVQSENYGWRTLHG